MAELPPLPPTAVASLFLEMRARVLSLAADLDRLQRHASPLTPEQSAELNRATKVLLDDSPNRAERVQMIFSDRSA